MEVNNITQPSTRINGQSTGNAVQFERSRPLSQQQQNINILQQSYEVSLSAGNESQALLYKAAIEQLNEILEPDLGARPLDSALESGLDISPEAVAERIVMLSTAMFDNYLDNHPELSEEAALERFMNLIESGINQGFEEAKEILDGLNVLEGDIASNIDQTYERVQEGLVNFRESFGFNYEEDDLSNNYNFTTTDSEIIGDEGFGEY